MVIYMRRIIMVLMDAVIINAGIALAMFIRFEGAVPIRYINIYIHSFIVLTLIELLIHYIFGLYRSLWRYASIIELMKIFLASTSGIGAIYLCGHLLDMRYPISVYMIAWLLKFLLLGGSRLSYRILCRVRIHLLQEETDKRRVMIVGAGDAGSIVIKELKKHKEIKAEPVVLIDDDKRKLGASIDGIPIKGGRNKIRELTDKYKVDEIIVAIPSVNKQEISGILNICKKTKCRLKTLPGVYEIIDEKVSVKHLRDVSIEDLLRREQVKLNTEEIAGYLKNEVVLVTGGGGFVGSELCRQIAGFAPKKLLIFDIYENGAYCLQNEIDHIYKKELNFEVLIGSVMDKERLRQVFQTYKPGVVFHAAAHKHVPLMEFSPAEAVKNNVLGTLYTAQCASDYGARKFILISTDKAVNPTDIIGATKRVAEMIVQSMDSYSDTEFAAVRFGNAIESSGSVLSLFKKQIARGGPVTVTHPEIKRFFITIYEAVQLVIQAGAIANGGEVFTLDMGQPIRIADLAKDLIRLSGLEPGLDIDIVYTGLRQGEKLYEELLPVEEDIIGTVHERIYVGKPIELSFNEVLLYIKALENNMHDSGKLRECVARVLPTYIYKYEMAAASRR